MDSKVDESDKKKDFDPVPVTVTKEDDSAPVRMPEDTNIHKERAVKQTAPASTPALSEA